MEVKLKIISQRPSKTSLLEVLDGLCVSNIMRYHISESFPNRDFIGYVELGMFGEKVDEFERILDSHNVSFKRESLHENVTRFTFPAIDRGKSGEISVQSVKIESFEEWDLKQRDKLEIEHNKTLNTLGYMSLRVKVRIKHVDVVVRTCYLEFYGIGSKIHIVLKQKGFITKNLMASDFADSNIENYKTLTSHLSSVENTVFMRYRNSFNKQLKANS